MKTRDAVIFGVLAGIGIGALAMQGLHAQAKPPVYMITENVLIDPDGYAKEYVPLAQASAEKYGGRSIAVGRPTVIEGDAPEATRVGVSVWDSLDQLRAWHSSPEYKAARKIGDRYAKFYQFAVEGVAH